MKTFRFIWVFLGGEIKVWNLFKYRFQSAISIFKMFFLPNMTWNKRLEQLISWDKLKIRPNFSVFLSRKINFKFVPKVWSDLIELCWQPSSKIINFRIFWALGRETVKTRKFSVLLSTWNNQESMIGPFYIVLITIVLCILTPFKSPGLRLAWAYRRSSSASN